MTKEEWDELENILTSPFGYAKLLIDGYQITLQTQLHKMKLCIAVYINGSIKGDLCLKDCEERRRFLRPHKVYLYKPKKRARLKKEAKEFPKRYNIDPDEHRTYGLHWWNSFRSLKSHLIKNNTSIELAPETA